jgi:hypothetical protein
VALTPIKQAAPILIIQNAAPKQAASLISQNVALIPSQNVTPTLTIQNVT